MNFRYNRSQQHTLHDSLKCRPNDAPLTLLVIVLKAHINAFRGSHVNEYRIDVFSGLDSLAGEDGIKCPSQSYSNLCRPDAFRSVSTVS